MSDIVKERVENSIGKIAKVFLHNGFRYEGKITNSDEQYVEILDFKTNAYKLIQFIDIKDCEVQQ